MTEELVSLSRSETDTSTVQVTSVDAGASLTFLRIVWDTLDRGSETGPSRVGPDPAEEKSFVHPSKSRKTDRQLQSVLGLV